MAEINLKEVKDFIVHIVEARQGIKGVDLGAKLAGEFFHYNLEGNVIIGILEMLVIEGRILEIEYVLPKMDYRVKSFYLPAGTIVRPPSQLAKENVG